MMAKPRYFTMETAFTNACIPTETGISNFRISAKRILPMYQWARKLSYIKFFPTVCRNERYISGKGGEIPVGGALSKSLAEI